jgi:stage II sporulation protein P
MLQYRMRSKPRRWGWVAVILVLILLLFIIASRPGSQEANPGSLPVTSQSTGGFGGTLLGLWSDLKAGAINLWAGLTGHGLPRQVDIDLSAQSVDGSGNDDEEEVALAGDIQVVISNPQAPEAFVPAGASPQVLIYHTHSYESYAKQDGQDYVECSKWRTKDNGYNVAAVGEALAKELSVKYGIAVLHDTTDNECSQLGTAYSRSLKTVEKDLKENPGLKILIDLHRDAYNAGINPDAVMMDGKKVARMMVVVGTGVGQTGVGFTEKPDWQKNILLAQAVTDELNGFYPYLARKVDVKTGRYNQHVSPGAILIEVGHNQNTLEDALNAVPYLAQAIADALSSMNDAGVYVAATPSSTISPPPLPSPSPSPAATPLPPAVSPSPSPSPSEPRVITLN